MNKSNAVILCRISDQKQEDGYSLDAQERFGIEYCSKKNFNVLKIFRFIETGSKVGKRHKFDSMMDYLKAQIQKQKTNDPLHLIVEKPDRLTRNFTNREQMQFFVMLGKLEIHYYKDRKVMDKNCSPADIFADDMMTSVSKYMALNTAREVKKGMAEKARTGWFPGRPPLGYKYIRDGNLDRHGRQAARIIIDEETKLIVHRIFELRAVEKYSYESIGSIIRTEFQSQLGQRKYKFNKSSIEAILLQPFYSGNFQWDGEMFQGKHDLFVPPSWIEIAQGKMRGKTKNLTSLGSFNLFLKCDVLECGCYLTYDPKKKKNRKTGEEHTYHYYRCTDGRGVHKRLGLKQVNVAEEKIWEQLGSIIEEATLPVEIVDILLVQLSERDHKVQQDFKKTHEEIKRALELLIIKQSEIYDDMKKGLIDEEDFKLLKDKTKEEIQILKMKLENNYEGEKEKVRQRMESTIELVKDMKSNWNLAAPSDRLLLVKKVLSNLTVNGASLRYDLKKSFGILAQIKNKGTVDKWWPRGESNSHALAGTGF